MKVYAVMISKRAEDCDYDELNNIFSTKELAEKEIAILKSDDKNIDAFICEYEVL